MRQIVVFAVSNNMKLIKANLRSIIILVLVVLGLIVTIYLVKNPQIFKSRADSSRFQITDKDGNNVPYDGSKFTTISDHITVGIQEEAVNKWFYSYN